jgi:hypothetical protein
VIPFPGQFAKGAAVIGIMIDPQGSRNAPPGATVNFSVINIGILTPDQHAFWIIDPKSIPALPGPVRIRPGPQGGIEIHAGPSDDTETSPVPPEPADAPGQPEKPDTAPATPSAPPAPGAPAGRP